MCHAQFKGRYQKFVKSAGKYQDKDGLYHYYYFATSQAFQGQALVEIKLIKLDTDAWTIENAGFILEK